MGHMQLLEHMDGHVLEGQVEEEGVSNILIPDFLSGPRAERMLAFFASRKICLIPTIACVWMATKIRLEYTHGNLDGHHKLVAKLDHDLDSFMSNEGLVRHHFQVTKMLPPTTAPRTCAARRGSESIRAPSVLDVSCKAHELDNLYITGCQHLSVLGRSEPDADNCRPMPGAWAVSSLNGLIRDVFPTFGGAGVARRLRANSRDASLPVVGIRKFHPKRG